MTISATLSGTAIRLEAGALDKLATLKLCLQRRNPLAATFNEDISAWDMSGAVTLAQMFDGAREFNQDLSWDVSRVISFELTFNNCTVFNGDISAWNTSNAGSMASMFNNATNFDRDLSRWTVGNV